MGLSSIICKSCGRTFRYEAEGEDNTYPPFGHLTGGDPDWEKDCNHCHFCIYEDCAVYQNKPQWVCDECFNS